MTTRTMDATAAGRHLLARGDEGELAFGSPDIFKAAAHNTGGRLDFIIATFSPMTGPPLHMHEEQDDTFYVLDGVLTVQTGDEILDLAPGDFISIPPRTPHTFDNVRNGEGLVRVVNVMTPGGLFPMIEDMARVPEGPRQSDGVAEATRQHGTLIVGPPLRVTLGLL